MECIVTGCWNLSIEDCLLREPEDDEGSQCMGTSPLASLTGRICCSVTWSILSSTTMTSFPIAVDGSSSSFCICKMPLTFVGKNLPIDFKVRKDRGLKFQEFHIGLNSHKTGQLICFYAINTVLCTDYLNKGIYNIDYVALLASAHFQSRKLASSSLYS